MKNFDYIIIGAGSSGCVIANRLSADKSKNVLLIEAGPKDYGFRFRMPVAQGLVVGKEKFDWKYMTQPDDSRHGMKEQWASGKVLGGGSSINGMLFLRGDAEDYDGWSSLGNKGWSFKEVLPYFKKMESYELGESEYRGGAGPVPVSKLSYIHPLSKLFVESGINAGLDYFEDNNCGSRLGVGYYQTNQKRGVRYSTARAYLTPVRGRCNLTVITDALASKILLEDKKAVGVEYIKKNVTHQISCNKEVIISAGTVASPKILMLSGIGPEAHLNEVGIEVKHSLPGVGQNLHEHAAGIMSYETTIDSLNKDLKSLKAIKHVFSWLFKGKGPMTSPVCQSTAHFQIDHNDHKFNIQIEFTPIGFMLAENNVELAKKSICMACVDLLNPISRGSIQLASNDPLEPPNINYQFFSNQFDLEAIREGCKFMRKIMNQNPFNEYVIAEHAPGSHINDDKQLDEYLKKNAARCFHPAGTCKMGNDTMAVVNHELKVHGIEGLRVADASIMPQVTSGNTMAPCIMIGEKAADMILSDSTSAHKLLRHTKDFAEITQLAPKLSDTIKQQSLHLDRVRDKNKGRDR